MFKFVLVLALAWFGFQHYQTLEASQNSTKVVEETVTLPATPESKTSEKTFDNVVIEEQEKVAKPTVIDSLSVDDLNDVDSTLTEERLALLQLIADKTAGY